MRRYFLFLAVFITVFFGLASLSYAYTEEHYEFDIGFGDGDGFAFNVFNPEVNGSHVKNKWCC